MIHPTDMVIEGFWDPGFPGPVCRACAVGTLGEASVARLTEGLGIGAPEWERMTRYELQERSTENGYEYGRDCAEPAHRPVERAGARFCEDCAEETCMECGARLDQWEDEPPSSEAVRVSANTKDRPA